MRIFVLGGDGFCGWPTSLKLAKEGHEVYIIDNQSSHTTANIESTGTFSINLNYQICIRKKRLKRAY